MFFGYLRFAVGNPNFRPNCAPFITDDSMVKLSIRNSFAFFILPRLRSSLILVELTVSPFIFVAGVQKYSKFLV